jgi:F-type H+-transporting ATPase subunit delta
MKSSREARKNARSLFRACLADGVLDPARVRTVADTIAADKPRGHLAILSSLARLVRLELQRRHVVIESAAALTDSEMSALRTDLVRTHGSDLTFATAVSPELIGGLRVRVGSDVWDGSVRARLAALPA